MAEKTKAHCNKCLGERSHDILHREERSWSDYITEQDSIGGQDLYETLSCRGCENVTLRHRHCFSEITNDDGSPTWHEDYYPPRVSRKQPEFGGLFFPLAHEFLDSALKEVYVALHNSSPWLAAMGIRAILEHLMASQVGDQRTFAAYLDAFEKAGHVAPKQRKILETLIEAGNASVHRQYRPSIPDLNTLLDITETLIETVLVHERQTTDLAKRIPPRKKP